MTSFFAVRTEADLLALIPFTLGFLPEDSLVLVTTARAGAPFHARIDLPHDPADRAGMAGMVGELLQAAVCNDADQALVVAYTGDEGLAEAAARAVVHELAAAGIETLVQLRADGSRWYPLGLHRPELRSLTGVPYDVRAHPLTSHAVLHGKVTFGSRKELVGSLAPVDPAAVGEVAAAHSVIGELADGREALLAEGRWLVAQLRALVRRSEAPVPLVTARILRAVQHRDVRDLAWCEVGHHDAAAHVRVWREVVRRSPSELVAPAAGLLAFAAWLAGDGALAWCAIDRSLSADPDHALARLVGQALEAAMPPSSWRPVDRRTLPLFTG